MALPAAGQLLRNGIAAVLVQALVGCSSETSRLPDDVRWTSEHFVYHTRAGDDTVCEGVLATLERHYAAMQAYLGLSLPAGYVIEYYKFESREDFQTNIACPEGTNGCQRQNTVYAVDPLHEHELIHAYLDPLGLPPPLLLEGIAQALSCSGFASLAAANAPSTWQVNTRKDAYSPGQWLVAHLLKRYGSAPFLRLYGSVGADADAAALATAFESIYGVALDDVWQAASTDVSPEVGCVFAWECQAERMTLAEPVRLSSRCDQSDRYRTLQVDQTGGFELAAEPSFAYVRACDGTPVAPFAERVEGLAIKTLTLTELERGSYLLKSDTSTALHVRNVSSALLAEQCTDAPLYEIPELLAGSRLVIPRHDSPRYLRFDAPQAADVWLWPEDAADAVSVCAACESACAAADGSEPYHAGSSFVLRIEGTPAPGFGDFTLQLVAPSL